MFDTTRTYFFGVATNEPNQNKEPQRPHFATGDEVYYYPPGESQGILVTVTGYEYDENGKIIATIERTVSGERQIWTVPAGRIKQ